MDSGSAQVEVELLFKQCFANSAQSGLVSVAICGEGQQRVDFPALLARATAAMEPLCLPSLLPVSMS